MGAGCFWFGEWKSCLATQPEPGLEESVGDSKYWPDESRKGADRQTDSGMAASALLMRIFFNKGGGEIRYVGLIRDWAFQSLPWRLTKEFTKIIWTVCWLCKTELLCAVILSFVPITRKSSGCRKDWGFGNLLVIAAKRPSSIKPELHHLLSMWSCSNYLISLCFSFLGKTGLLGCQSPLIAISSRHPLVPIGRAALGSVEAGKGGTGAYIIHLCRKIQVSSLFYLLYDQSLLCCHWPHLFLQHWYVPWHQTYSVSSGSPNSCPSKMLWPSPPALAGSLF